jgi:MFS transporter, UMF1 family
MTKLQRPLPALDRDYQRVVNAWAMYDWANSAFAVVILTAIFPVYYRTLVTNAGGAPEDATAYWAYTTSLSMLIVALAGPLLGAMSDVMGAKKRFLGVALGFGVLGSMSLAFLGKDTFLLGSLLFAVGNLGFAGGNIFYESLLPMLARPNDLDRVSARGYAFGYLGGGLLLILNVLWLYWPERFGFPDRDFALRLCFVSVALWWLGFALPLFLKVSEPDAKNHARFSWRVVGIACQRLGQTLKQIRHYRQLTLFLAAFWLYNDGINTIIKLAAAYGAEIGVDHNQMLVALILTQLVGFPCSIGFATLAGHIGAKRAVLLGLAVYAVISIGGFFMKTAAHFFVLAIVVGLVQGGTQALSRSLFATMVPKTRSTEFFGFFSTGEKMAGIIGPAVFGFIAQMSGSSRWGIVSVTALFVVGALLLWRVDAAEGQKIAAAVDASA